MKDDDKTLDRILDLLVSEAAVIANERIGEKHLFQKKKLNFLKNMKKK